MKHILSHHRIFIAFGLFVLAGACGFALFALYPREQSATGGPAIVAEMSSSLPESETDENIFLPIRNFYRNQTERRFGWPFTGRFNGYHIADDIEVEPEELDEEIPVYAIDDGTVLVAENVGGYGGIIAIEHVIEGERIVAIYGHMSIHDAAVEVGSSVRAGERIGYLGEGFSEETDGNRKHLHFGLYHGGGLDIRGYLSESQKGEIDKWLNPTVFLSRLGAKEVESPPAL
jgi:murein DD-endopeptidase MepM/ murein hydrolase activator NlpD